MFPAVVDPQSVEDSLQRSVVKAFVWRLFSTSTTLAIAFVFFGENMQVRMVGCCALTGTSLCYKKLTVSLVHLMVHHPMPVSRG
jgi:hypothetical protein